MLHMALYMFQCYSLKSSHLLPLQLCPKICSLCLHLHCCPISVSSFEDYFLRERFYYFCEEDECTRCNYELELNLPSIFIPKRIRDHHSPPPPFIYILLGNGDWLVHFDFQDISFSISTSRIWSLKLFLVEVWKYCTYRFPFETWLWRKWGSCNPFIALLYALCSVARLPKN